MIILLLAIPVILSAQAPPQQEALGFIAFNEGKIVSLANAFTNTHGALQKVSVLSAKSSHTSLRAITS